MDNLEKSTEIESIKRLIFLLSRKGYILKSELEHILVGCRHNTFALNDLAQIMHECIDENTKYIDDSCSISIVSVCIELQDQLKQMGYDDLFEYLDISCESTAETVRLALRKRHDNNECDDKINPLISNDGRDTYELVLRTQSILDELKLRRDFNILGLRQFEYERYLKEIILNAFVSENVARLLLDMYMEYFSFVLEHDIEMHKDHVQLVDKYLVCINGEQLKDNKSDFQREVYDKRSKENG